MNRAYFFILVVLFGTLISYFADGSIGVSQKCFNDECFLRASTSILSIIFSVIFSICLFFIPRKKFTYNSELIVRSRRRISAFIIDFVILLVCATPISALPMILMEYSYTDNLAWSFQRDFVRSTDSSIMFPTMLFIFTLLFYYFYKHLMLNKQTVGQYVLGYRIKFKDDVIDKSSVIFRLIYSYFGLCIWPLSWIFAMFNDRVYWWDKTSNTSVELIEK